MEGVQRGVLPLQSPVWALTQKRGHTCTEPTSTDQPKTRADANKTLGLFLGVYYGLLWVFFVNFNSGFFLGPLKVYFGFTPSLCTEVWSRPLKFLLSYNITACNLHLLYIQNTGRVYFQWSTSDRDLLGVNSVFVLVTAEETQSGPREKKPQGFCWWLISVRLNLGGAIMFPWIPPGNVICLCINICVKHLPLSVNAVSSIKYQLIFLLLMFGVYWDYTDLNMYLKF